MPSLKSTLEDMARDFNRLAELEKKCNDVIVINGILASTNETLREENYKLKNENEDFRREFQKMAETVEKLSAFFDNETEIR